MSLVYILQFLLVISCTKLILIEAINYESKIEEITLTTVGAMTMELTISDSDDLVEIILTGPSFLYYSIGVGSCTMSNTWSIVLEGEGESSTPFEQYLGKDRAGTLVDSTFDVIDDTTNGLLRTVTLQRSLSTLIDEDIYYPFTSDDDEIEVMWAYGTKAKFSNHGEDQRGCTTLSFAKTVQESRTIFNWRQLFSTNSSYLFGQSPLSVLAVMILLCAVMIYAIFRYCVKSRKGEKLLNKAYAFKNNDNEYDELESLINDNEIQKYVAL